MKRIIVPLIVAAVLVVPGQAIGSTRKLDGTFPSGGSLNFTLVKKHGKTKVKHLLFQHVPVSCDQGTAKTAGTIPTTRVRKGSFGFAGDFNDSHLQVEGTVKMKNKAASGTLRVFGTVPIEPDFNTTGTNCDTGDLVWSASA